MTASPPTADGRRISLLGSLAAALAVLALMLATEPRLAIAWDEYYTLRRLERMRLWFDALRDPPGFAATWERRDLRRFEDPSVRPPSADEIDTTAELFAPQVVDWFWPFARQEPNGHPPFYAEVALLGDVLTPGRTELARARLGTMLAFSLAAGAIFAALARRRGVGAGVVGAGAWALQPHLFALGHYATYDALLSSLWVGALLAFARAVESPGRNPRWGAAIGFGVLLGWALGTKLTGWLIPLPLLAWSIGYRDRRGFLTLLVGGLTSIAIVYLVTPPFWANPLAGVVRFFTSNLSRAETIPIRVLFLGHIYNTPRESLPPYNTLVWTVFVTPVGFLALAVVGAVGMLRRLGSSRFGVLVAGNWAFLLLLRALPGSPGHDGVRQFLPAFGCLALMAGLGGGDLIDWLGRRAWPWLAGALVGGAVSVAVMMPVPLSYFSPVVGGLPGATALGMEPTYYWDAMTPKALARLDERAGDRGVVLFVANPIAAYYKEKGLLEAGLYPRDGRNPEWYVLQNRPGAMSEDQRALVRRLGSDPRYILSKKLGVPLVWAFPAEAVEDRR